MTEFSILTDQTRLSYAKLVRIFPLGMIYSNPQMKSVYFAKNVLADSSIFLRSLRWRVLLFILQQENNHFPIITLKCHWNWLYINPTWIKSLSFFCIHADKWNDSSLFTLDINWSVEGKVDQTKTSSARTTWYIINIKELIK